MDYNHISTLLQRYFEGETTLEEERALRRYFTAGPVAEAHRPYEDLFRFFEAEQKMQFSSDLLPEKIAPAVTRPKPTAFHRLRPVFGRAAAVVLLALGAWWLYPEAEPQPSQTAIDWSKYEPATPEEAFRITSSALKKASANLNYGAKQAAEEISKVQKIQKIF